MAAASMTVGGKGSGSLQPCLLNFRFSWIDGKMFADVILTVKDVLGKLDVLRMSAICALRTHACTHERTHTHTHTIKAAKYGNGHKPGGGSACKSMLTYV